MLFACSTSDDARNMAFALHPDWEIGNVETFVARNIWSW
jgi:hypothetical protein